MVISLAGRKKEPDAVVKVQSVQKKFTKEQMLASAKYRNQRDLVEALLDAGKKYTVEMVDKLIDDFMKGKVK